MQILNCFLILLLSFYINLIFVFANYDKNKLHYYQELLDANEKEMNQYKYPSKNTEFSAGITATEIQDYGVYDFIIVGAGAAGAVLATRLSEISTWSILLIEAGGDETDFSLIPGLSQNLQLTEMNWGYLTIPQNNSCLGMKEHKCVSPRGKAMGGSTAINSMVYARGNADDFNKWAQVTNSSQWAYKNVLPYFKKSENNQIDGDYGYHGKEGWLSVIHPEPVEEQLAHFLQASIELNRTLLDYNGKEQNGFSRSQMTVKPNGQRDSANQAFLTHAKNRKNLKIITKALVTKILIDKNTANGVIFVQGNKKYKTTTSKEIFVCGGAINSPQLLMLSGIGPRKHLEEKNITVIADLPVGKNLLEHPQFFGLRFRTNISLTNANRTKQLEDLLQGKGFLTFGSNLQGIGYLPEKTGPPIIEFLCMPSNGTGYTSSKFLNYDKNIEENYMNGENLSNSIQLRVILLHEKSKGSVTLKSNNPIDFPNIDFNMLTDEKNEDVKKFIEGIRYVLKLTETEAYRSINATFVDYPVCKEYKKNSNKYWECALRHFTSTTYHPQSTTAMGIDKQNSVVDPDLKVHGIKNLRVIDAGVFPTSSSGHTTAPTIMLAEKMADKIKADYNGKLLYN